MSENNSDLEKVRKKLALLDGGNQFGSGGFYDISNKTSSEGNMALRDSFRRRAANKKDQQQQEEVKESSISQNLDIDKEDAKMLIDDYEQTNAYNTRLIRGKLRRNKVIISVLLILLLVSLATIIVAYVFLNLDKTCYVNVVGDVSADCIVDGHSITSFRVPSSIKGNRVLKLDIDLKINEPGDYNIKYKAVCFQDEDVLANTQIYQPNEELFQAVGNGYYGLIAPVEGGKVIDLCGGVIIDYHYEESLNVNNFSMQFEIIIEKVESISN